MVDLSKARVPAAWVGICVLGLWEAYQFVEGRYTHQPTFDVAMEQVAEESMSLEAKIVERDLMSASTRYAEIVKFYTDKMADGETLTPAEKKRLELAQRQQLRIAEILEN